MKSIKSLYKATLTDEYLQLILMTGNISFNPRKAKCYSPHTTKKKYLTLTSKPVLHNLYYKMCYIFCNIYFITYSIIFEFCAKFVKIYNSSSNRCEVIFHYGFDLHIPYD